MSNQSDGFVNTDRELYREDLHDPLDPNNSYSPRIFVTNQGEIGIAVGGNVIVMSIYAWHALARQNRGHLIVDYRGL